MQCKHNVILAGFCGHLNFKKLNFVSGIDAYHLSEIVDNYAALESQEGKP